MLLLIYLSMFAGKIIIEHRKTKVKHLWTNGQLERMDRTLKDATVNVFYHATHDQLKVHLNAYLMAYNFAKRLKAIKGNTPWQFILKQWIDYPQYFIINSNHYFKGSNKLPSFAIVSLILVQAYSIRRILANTKGNCIYWIMNMFENFADNRYKNRAS